MASFLSNALHFVICTILQRISGIDFNNVLKRKLWSSGRALGSQSEGREFNPRPMLDGSGVKNMPGLIPTPTSGSLKKNKKIKVAKWGTPKKIFKKTMFYEQHLCMQLPKAQKGTDDVTVFSHFCDLCA